MKYRIHIFGNQIFAHPSGPKISLDECHLIPYRCDTRMLSNIGNNDPLIRIRFDQALHYRSPDKARSACNNNSILLCHLNFH